MGAMNDRLLTNIIELEKTLQEELVREEARASVWREREGYFRLKRFKGYKAGAG